MSIRSLADFNGVVPSVVGRPSVRTDTVGHRGKPVVDHINKVGTFAGHTWGLSHGHGQPRQESPFPLSTLIVNISGSTALGALVGAITGGHVPESVLSWAGTGFLGGYITLSTFTYETVRLIEDGVWRQVAWNVALSGPLSYAGAAAGYWLLK